MHRAAIRLWGKAKSRQVIVPTMPTDLSGPYDVHGSTEVQAHCTSPLHRPTVKTHCTHGWFTKPKQLCRYTALPESLRCSTWECRRALMHFGGAPLLPKLAGRLDLGPCRQWIAIGWASSSSSALQMWSGEAAIPSSRTVYLSHHQDYFAKGAVFSFSRFLISHFPFPISASHFQLPPLSLFICSFGFEVERRPRSCHVVGSVWRWLVQPRRLSDRLHGHNVEGQQRPHPGYDYCACPPCSVHRLWPHGLPAFEDGKLVALGVEKQEKHRNRC
jgi:hypothetical protein